MPARKAIKPATAKPAAAKPSTTARKPAVKTSTAPASTQKFTRFSSQLTGSLDQISGMIEQNAKMIDSIQEVSLELTNSIGTLHALTVKYAGTANAILDMLLPILRSLPIIPQNIMDLLVNLERMTQQIIDSQAKTSKTISEVQSGLRDGDVGKLQSHAGDLQSLTTSLLAILPKS